MSPPVPTFYFSLRSPYSWLALHDLRLHYPKLLARLELKPFWEPDADYQGDLGVAGEAFLYTAMSREKHLYILTDIKRLATRRGLPVRWPVDKAPAWEVPHLAYLRATQTGQGRAYLQAITDMRWLQGRDICDPATVAEVGAQLGLEALALHEAHRDPAIRRQGLDALRDCIKGDVFGVPYFSLGRERYWGIDRLPDFVGAVANVAPPEALQTGSADQLLNRALHDHAGGCG